MSENSENKENIPSITNDISIEKIQETYQQSRETLLSHVNNLYTPNDDLSNVIIKDNISEKLATVNHTVTTAQIYLDLKARGITKITDSENNQYPIDILLTENQQLKEILDQPGFSLNNPQNLHSVVEYGINEFNNAPDNSDNIASLSNRLAYPSAESAKSSKELNNQIETVLKNVPIGNNIKGDLSSFNNEINDISTEDANKQVERKLRSLQREINTPTRNNNQSVILTAKANIGKLTVENAFAIHNEADPNLTFEKPHHQLKSSDIELVNDQRSDCIGYQRDGKITIFTHAATDDEIEKIQKREAEKGAYSTEFNIEHAKGNKMTHMLVALHETCHMTQEKRINSQSALDDPSITLKKNTLIEKTAFSVEMLAVANMHKQLKEQGVTTLTYEDKDGIKTMPVDDLLNLYPGLKDTVKDGFSPENSEDVRKVVNNASNLWDAKYKDSYKQQAVNAAKGVNKRLPTFSEQLKLVEQGPRNQEKEYDKDVKCVLKDVYIGGNISVDLSHCRDLLDTGNPGEIVNLGKENEFPEGKVLLSAKFEDKKDKILPKETLLKLNTHLEKIGIKTDKEKDEYIKEAFTAIVTRSAEAEKYDELKNILLENGGAIKYADRLVEIHDVKNHTIAYEISGSKFTVPQQGCDNTSNKEKSVLTFAQMNQILQQNAR